MNLFPQKTEDGVFAPYSDINSGISHPDQIGKVPLAPGGANLPLGAANPFNPVARVGWVNLPAATILMYGPGRIHGRKEALEKEREPHE